MSSRSTSIRLPLVLTCEPQLDMVPHGLEDITLEAFEEGDATGFLGMVGNEVRTEFFIRNIPALKARGVYEGALLFTFTTGIATKDTWAWLFRLADEDKLKGLAPCPTKGPFTLYRGVAGIGRRRWVGMSWTGSLDIARWFAGRRRYGYESAAGHDPAVFQITVDEAQVAAYTNDRGEDEYIVPPWSLPSRPRRLERVSKDAWEGSHNRWRKAQPDQAGHP